MMGKAHALLGFSMGTLLSALLVAQGEANATSAAGVVACSTASALLPDIDLPTSKMGRLFPFISVPINKIFGHRTITHSIFPILIGMCLMRIRLLDFSHNPLFISFLVGFLGHLMQDSLTVQGCPWLYPVVRKRFSFCKAKTGACYEFLLTILVLIVYGGAMWFSGPFLVNWIH